jgi:hypothetical protein
MDAKKKNIRIRIQNANALTWGADVLVLKYAQASYALDMEVLNLLRKRLGEIVLPKDGQYHLVNSMNQLGSRSILFVGVKPLFHFRYREIREFTRRAFAILAEEAPETKHICLTLHGANFGLDEVEAFQSEIAGTIDALDSSNFPPRLEEISIVETKQTRAERLQNELSRLLPGGYYEPHARNSKDEPSNIMNERFRLVGYNSDSKPHIFVAMPFREDMEDVYEYAIKRSVNDAGFICERTDLSAFTGEILERVKSRIKSSALVVAELTGANPNVYLEVGFAWGCGVPTMLLARDAEELKFDVQGQRCLYYKRIKDLEKLLREELQGLYKKLT